MQPGDKTPPVPQWFASQMLALLACYPNAQAGRATVLAYWERLFELQPEAILCGLKKAPEAAENKNFPPSAFLILEHARAWRPPTPRPDLERPALPEPAPEISPELRKDFEAINSAVRNGELDGNKAGAAFLRAIAERL